MENSLIIKYCVIGNIIILVFVFLLAVFFRDSSNYWNIGPNNNFYVLGVKIDNTFKYIILTCIIGIINISKVLIESNGVPIIHFNVYNIDKPKIVDFSKNELHFYTNTMTLMSNIRNIFLILVTISQIDIAFQCVLFSEITSIFVVRALLNKKTFTKTKKVKKKLILDKYYPNNSEDLSDTLPYIEQINDIYSNKENNE